MRHLIRTASRALGWSAAALALSLVVALIVVPRVTGGAALTVVSGSMEPTYPVGSIVVVLPVAAYEVAPGDVITYQRAPGVAEFVTHRVVDVHADTEPRTFTTKGDANRVLDADPVAAGAVRGRVAFHVPLVGLVAQRLQGPAATALVAAPLLVWFLMTQVRVVVVEVRARRAGQPVPPSERVRRSPGRAAAGPTSSVAVATMSDGPTPRPRRSAPAPSWRARRMRATTRGRA
jgi:signal peptidase